MRDLPIKIDDSGDTLSAGDFNAQNSELEHIVESSDITLDVAGGPDNDLDMLSKSVSGYANAGSTYQDSGTVNAYVLSITSNLKSPVKYYDNMTITFKAGNSNTGASTVNINTIGVKDITTEGGIALLTNDLISNNYYTLVYNFTNNRFELIKEALTEHIWGTQTQTIAGVSTFYTLTNGLPLNAVAASVTIAQDDKILIIHDVTATANQKLVLGGKKVDLRMSKGVNWNLDTFALDLGETTDNFSGDIELIGTGTLTITNSNGFRVHHTAMTVLNNAGDVSINNELNLTGSTSGVITLKTAAVTTTRNEIRPAAAPTNGQLIAIDSIGQQSYVSGIVQTVQNHVDTISSVSTTINVRVQIPTLTATITTKFLNSRIKISYRWCGEFGSINSQESLFGIQRGSTDIGNPATAGNRSLGITVISQGHYDQEADENSDSCYLEYIDSPSQSAGTAIIYSATFINSNTTNTLFTNRTVLDLDTESHERLTSTMILEEIAA